MNFDIIYKSILGEKISESDLKNYQTVKYERVKKYPLKDKNDFLGAAFRSDKISFSRCTGEMFWLQQGQWLPNFRRFMNLLIA